MSNYWDAYEIALKQEREKPVIHYAMTAQRLGWRVEINEHMLRSLFSIAAESKTGKVVRGPITITKVI